MKRRNVEATKHRKQFHFKKCKFAEGIYGSTSFVYLKFICIWILIMIADYILEFRFEFLWPLWLIIRSLHDSFRYQGLIFSIFFALIAFLSDLLCYMFLPVQWLFFAASTYVWVQYVWHTEKGICLSTISLWLLFVYIEASLRLKSIDKSIENFCKPFAAHCIGYPIVTLGFGFKSYISYKLRLRKQKEIQKSNEFYLELIEKALPLELQTKKKDKFKELNYEEEISSQNNNPHTNTICTDLQQSPLVSSTSSSSLTQISTNQKEKTTSTSSTNTNTNLKSSSGLIASALSFYLNSSSPTSHSQSSSHHQIEDLPYIQQKDIGINTNNKFKSNSNLNGSSAFGKNTSNFSNYPQPNNNNYTQSLPTTNSSGGNNFKSKTESINCNLTSSNSISIASLTSTFSTDTQSSPSSSSTPNVQNGSNRSNSFNVNNHNLLLVSSSDSSDSQNSKDNHNHRHSTSNNQHDRSSSSSNSTASSTSSSSSTTTTTTHTFLPSNSNSNQTNININMTINTAAIAAATATATATSGGNQLSTDSTKANDESSSSSNNNSYNTMNTNKKGNKVKAITNSNTNGSIPNGTSMTASNTTTNSNGVVSSKNQKKLNKNKLKKSENSPSLLLNDELDQNNEELDTDADYDYVNKNDLVKRLEDDLKKLRIEIEQQKAVEEYLRNQINYITKCDKAEKLKLEKLQKENEALQSKYAKLSAVKQKEKDELDTMEKRLQEEKRSRTFLEMQLSQERKLRENQERLNAVTNNVNKNTKPVMSSVENQGLITAASVVAGTAVAQVSCTENCKKKTQDYENENKLLNEECRKKQERLVMLECEVKNQAKQREAESRFDSLMIAFKLMEDKNASLQESLSAETRFKLDLFSALGETRRQLEAVNYQLESKERELNAFKSIFKQTLSLPSSDISQNDLISQYLANQLNSLQNHNNTSGKNSPSTTPSINNNSSSSLMNGIIVNSNNSNINSNNTSSINNNK